MNHIRFRENIPSKIEDIAILPIVLFELGRFLFLFRNQVNRYCQTRHIIMGLATKSRTCLISTWMRSRGQCQTRRAQEGVRLDSLLSLA